MEELGTEADREHGDGKPVGDPVEGSSGGRRSGSLIVLGGTVFAGFAALAALAALLVVSPASFVSFLPEWLVADDRHRTAAWLIAGLSAAAAGLLAVRRDQTQWLRDALIALLGLVAAGAVVYALKSEPTREMRAPSPDTTCVAYSGGRQTCPGG